MKRYKQSERVAAIDLGAESGRVAVGQIKEGRVELDIVHRFPNSPVGVDGGLRWNLEALFDEAVAGLRGAGAISSVAVDGWGCDYGLLDEQGDLLAPPFHHRGARTYGVPERAFAVVAKEELYMRTGAQHLRFNTVFQLLADVEAGLELERAARIALIPDLFTYWLSGVLINEATIASTTGLTDVTRRAWDEGLVARFGLPPTPFRSQLTEPGAEVGLVDRRVARRVRPLVRAVAAHDTASAYAATPFATPDAAVISCGTWSLVGVELRHPCFGPAAAEANLGNEWGIDGTTRLLRNVMGLWILQECRRQWNRGDREPLDYDGLQLLAGAVATEVPIFDPDLDLFLGPGDMPSRIAAVCRESGQSAPASRGELVRSIFLSLACAYQRVVEDVRRVSGHSINCIHLVGGGARNQLLCQLIADVTQLPVLAGPVEAAALGNVLVQLRASGAFASLEEMRACVARSLPPVRYEPAAPSSDYQRFCDVARVQRGVGAEVVS